MQAEGAGVSKGRLEAFSDGVIAILITIMVLELRVPEETDLQALQGLGPVFVSYVLSFINLGTYWNNHHHLLQAASVVNGRRSSSATSTGSRGGQGRGRRNGERLA